MAREKVTVLVTGGIDQGKPVFGTFKGERDDVGVTPEQLLNSPTRNRLRHRGIMMSQIKRS